MILKFISPLTRTWRVFLSEFSTCKFLLIKLLLSFFLRLYLRICIKVGKVIPDSFLFMSFFKIQNERRIFLFFIFIFLSFNLFDSLYSLFYSLLRPQVPTAWAAANLHVSLYSLITLPKALVDPRGLSSSWLPRFPVCFLV